MSHECLSCKHGDMFPSTTTYFCPADLCHQWCHKFVVLVGFVKLLHAVESAAVEAFDAGIGLCDIRCHLINMTLSPKPELAHRLERYSPTFQYIWISSALTAFKARVRALSMMDRSSSNCPIFCVNSLLIPAPLSAFAAWSVSASRSSASPDQSTSPQTLQVPGYP